MEYSGGRQEPIERNAPQLAGPRRPARAGRGAPPGRGSPSPYSKVGGRPTSRPNPSPAGKEHEMNRIRTTQGTIVLAVAALVFTGVLGAGVASAQNAHFSTQALRDYQQWIENLSSQ